MKKSLLYTTLGLVAILALANFVAISFYFYWIFWWFDNVAHFLGGFSLGFFSLYIFFESKVVGNNASLAKKIFISLAFTLILGGAWEIFEYLNGMTHSTEKYSLDIKHDLLADALGAIIAPLVAKRFLKSS